MSIKRRIDELENRTPKNSIIWDGSPETAETFVKTYIARQDGDGPQNKDKMFAEYEGDDPQAYVEQIIGDTRV